MTAQHLQQPYVHILEKYSEKRKQKTEVICLNIYCSFLV